MFSFFKKKEYKLTPIQELLLALLRAQLWLKPVDDIVLPSTHEEWDELINLGYKQTVICFIAKACLRHPDAENIPTEIKEEFEAVLEENKRIHEHHNGVLIDLITKFEEQGLHPILLKGQGIAQMYPEPELRQCGDIDLFFRAEEYEQAEAYIKSIEDESEEHIINYKHYETCYKGITVEVHKHTSWIPNPFANKRFQQFAADEMKCPDIISIEGKAIYIPSPIYNIVSVFAHMWHHFEDCGVSLRQMCDVALMNCYYGICEQESRGECLRLKKILVWISYIKFWKISGCVFSDYFGLPKDKFALYEDRYSERARIMLSLVLTDGAFNYKPKIEFEGGFVSDLKTRWKRQVTTHRSMMHVYPVSGYNILWRYAQVKKIAIYKVLKYIAERN